MSKVLGITSPEEWVVSIAYANFRFEFLIEEGKELPILCVGKDRFDLKKELENLQGKDRTNTKWQALRTGWGLLLGIFKGIGNDPVKLSEESIFLEKEIDAWPKVIFSSWLLKHLVPIAKSEKAFSSRVRYLKSFIKQKGLKIDVEAKYTSSTVTSITLSRQESKRTSQKTILTK